MPSEITASERMTVAASRLLRNRDICFVGIGLPSKAANLARRTHAPDLVLVYEAGPIGAKPTVLPLSIGDGELATTADAVVSTPEIFRYWLQGGRVTVGFLGAAQIDRFANLNTTVIGDYAHPKTRLPGAGGAPEIAAMAGEVFLVLNQSKRSFVQRLDFVTTVGFLDGGDARSRLKLPGKGPTVVVTDLGILRPDPVTRELVMTELHRGVTVEQALAATAWPLRIAPDWKTTQEPTHDELATLRSLGGGERPSSSTDNRGQPLVSVELDFIHESHPARVRFGRGSRHHVADEVKRLSLERVMVLAAPALAAETQRALGNTVVATLTEATMHVPKETVKPALELATAKRADGILAIGGGSTVGLAKAIALETGLPIVATPTTFAGSEMTSVWGVTEDGQKRTGRDPKVRPRTVLYDPELYRTLPKDLRAQSGLNAMAHAVEALYAPGVDPITLLYAEESIRALAQGLPDSLEDDSHLDRAVYGAWLAGVCLDRAPMGLHHKLCHVLGGTFRLPHASVHAIMLPHVVRWLSSAAPDAMERLGQALSEDDPVAGLVALGRRLGAPTSLASIGMDAVELDRAADIATQSPYRGPREASRADIRALLGRAQIGVL